MHEAPGPEAAISERGQTRARDTQAGAGSKSNASFASLFVGPNLRATILASVPWFLQDLGTYGIGIFTPTILAAAVGANEDHRAASPI